MADISNNLPMIRDVGLQIQHGKIVIKEKLSTIKSYKQQIEDLGIQEDRLRLNIETTELEIQAIKKKIADLEIGKS